MTLRQRTIYTLCSYLRASLIQ